MKGLTPAQLLKKYPSAQLIHQWTAQDIEHLYRQHLVKGAYKHSQLHIDERSFKQLLNTLEINVASHAR